MRIVIYVTILSARFVDDRCAKINFIAFAKVKNVSSDPQPFDGNTDEFIAEIDYRYFTDRREIIFFYEMPFTKCFCEIGNSRNFELM